MKLQYLLSVLAGFVHVSANDGYGAVNDNDQGYGVHDDYEHVGYGRNDDYAPHKTEYAPSYNTRRSRSNYGREDDYAREDDYDRHDDYGREDDYDRHDDYYGRENDYDRQDDYGRNDDYDAEPEVYNYGATTKPSRYQKPQSTYAPPAYNSFSSHYKETREKPFAYTTFASEDASSSVLKVPKLGDYHCFLTGAPWTSCGRKSLTSYFLDQCLVFYFEMSTNVDGICGGEVKPKPQPIYEDDDYNYEPPKPTSEPKPTTTAKPIAQDGYGTPSTTAPTETYEVTPEYLKEKCYQTSYVSITTATVMCLTENYIRINFIEHYAANACGNPVEGPILYLKKLHGFINEVLDCTGDDASRNYPNLYRTFTVGDRVAYNPNAPFYLDRDNQVAMEQGVNDISSGLDSFTIGSSFMCADPTDLTQYDPTDAQSPLIYLTIPSTTHYSVGNPDGTFDAATNMYATCTLSQANAALGKEVYRFCKSQLYTSDKSLRSLYDSVHFVERATTALRRPQTIAELAVRSAGLHEQPILEGFGIMYYCAFHACRANNDGDLSKCYPEFKDEDDWNVSGMRFAELKSASDEINDCVKDGYLDVDDIMDSDKVQVYNALLAERSYLCLAENLVVNFFQRLYPDWYKENDASKYVYGRHLADEKCHGEQVVSANGDRPHKPCATYGEVYDALKQALAQLKGICKQHQKDKRKHDHHDRRQPQYGNPTYDDAYGSNQYDEYQPRRRYGHH